MIHQFIFAGPKPGLSAEAFQSYWLNFHAVDYAAKIPQIKQYLVAPRIRSGAMREVDFFEGVAEIWLEDDEAQIASLQSQEFLNGARLDEPRWAAFWQSFVLDADSIVLHGNGNAAKEFTKTYVLVKRAPNMDVDEFRDRAMREHSKSVLGMSGLEKYEMSFARSGLYGFGEPRFDLIESWSFVNGDAKIPDERAKQIEESWKKIADTRYIFTFTGKEHWIIPPGRR
jgi:hypothetical protein